MSKFAAPVSIKAIAGILLVGIACYLLARLFADPVRQELSYYTRATSSSEISELIPPNHDFSLVIEKIRATSVIVVNIDPFNPTLYQQALTKGIAHAKGTAMPGEGKNIFLFSHSSSDLMTALRYNSVFYLLHHLEAGDEIKVWYLGDLHKYVVSEKKIVLPSETQYLSNFESSETLTLMTCYPPGTALRRLIIVASLAK